MLYSVCRYVCVCGVVLFIRFSHWGIRERRRRSKIPFHKFLKRQITIRKKNGVSLRMGIDYDGWKLGYKQKPESKVL